MQPLLYETAKHSLRGATFTVVTTTRAIDKRFIPIIKPAIQAQPATHGGNEVAAPIMFSLHNLLLIDLNEQLKQVS